MAEGVGYTQENAHYKILKNYTKNFLGGTYIFGVGGILCRERPQEAEDFGWERFICGD